MPIPPKATRKEGRILAINEAHGFVVVDLGNVDNLKKDAILSVRKDGEKLATLSVMEVRDVMAACNIKDLKAGKSLAINDVVTLGA